MVVPYVYTVYLIPGLTLFCAAPAHWGAPRLRPSLPFQLLATRAASHPGYHISLNELSHEMDLAFDDMYG